MIYEIGLTEQQIARIKATSRELAQHAARNHGGQVEWAYSHLKAWLESVKSELVSETGNRWGVVVEAEQIGGDVLAAHSVSVAEADSSGAVLDRPIQLAITTEVSQRGTDKGWAISYTTKVRSLFDDVIAEVTPDMAVGAMVV